MKKPKHLSVDQQIKDIIKTASSQGISLIILISTEASPSEYLLTMHGYSPCLANLLMKAANENEGLRRVISRVVADLKISDL